MIPSHGGGASLYQGKMIWQFDAEFANAQYFLDIADFDQRLRSKEIYRLKQDLGLDSKAYEKLLESLYPKVSKEGVEDSLIKYDREFIRLGFREIARDTDERTLIASLLPKNCGIGNKIWHNIPKKYILEKNTITHKQINYLRICFALGIFNSLVVDFIVRGMVQITVNKTYISRIPIPQPSDGEILENAIYLSIAKNALILQLHNDKAGHFKELADEFQISKDEIPSTPKLYDTLKAKNDIVIAKEIYKLNKSQFFSMLKTFKVLNTKQPAFIALLESLWEE